MVTEFSMGDIVRLKKPHPCGGYDWEVVRLGADIGLRCMECDRRILVTRSLLDKRIKSRVSEV